MYHAIHPDHEYDEHNWLVVSTPLKNMSQLGLFPIYGKIKNVPNHQPDNLIATFTSGCLTNKSSQIIVHNNISMKPVKLPFTKLLQRFEISMMTFQFRYILG
jgi:hypothetical protein